MKILIDGKDCTPNRALSKSEQVSNIEVLNNQNDFIRPQESTESGEILDSLFQNDYDPVTKTHGIDQKANLDEYQVRGLTALDVLERVSFLPRLANSVSMQTKFLSVSKNARGRNDHIDIIQGKKDHEVSVGGGGIMKGLIGMNK